MSTGDLWVLNIYHLHHAVLDEATNALSEGDEALMYTNLREMGITLLSIGHRSSITHVSLRGGARGVVIMYLLTVSPCHPHYHWSWTVAHYRELASGSTVLTTKAILILSMILFLNYAMCNII